MILQSGAGSSTILIELFLFVITSCAIYVAKKARDIYQRQEKQGEQINTNSMLLVGEDGTPYDGLVPEVQKNSNRLDNHKQLLKRIKRVLEREGKIADTDVLEDFDDTMPDGGNIPDEYR